MSFARNDSGNATIEFVLWLPLLVTLIIFFFEVNMVLIQSNRAHDVARTVTRQVAVGAWSEQKAEQEVLQILPARLNPSISIFTDEANDVRFNLDLSPSIGALDIWSIMQLSDISIRFVMRSEIQPVEEEEEEDV